MAKAARLGEFHPNRFFFRILFLEIVILTALFVRQFGMTLPADDGDWPLSIFSLVNLGFAGCIALFAGFFHQGDRFVKLLLLATGTLFLAAPPLQAMLPDHTVDYQDWAALFAWFLSFGLIGLILIYERANIVVQALFLGGLILQATVMFGDLAFDDFLRPDIAVGFMDWAYVLGSAIAVLCFLLGFQLFASRAAETAEARAFGSRLRLPGLARGVNTAATVTGDITCIDYGKDGLRIGQLARGDVAPGQAIDTDLANWIATDGLARLSDELKNPLRLAISKATLRQARKTKADLIVATDVLRHVPPLELDDFLARILGLMHSHTTVVMDFDEGESRFQKNADSWLYGRQWLQQKASRQKQDAHISFVPDADKKRTYLVIQGADANPDPTRPH